MALHPYPNVTLTVAGANVGSFSWVGNITYTDVSDRLFMESLVPVTFSGAGGMESFAMPRDTSQPFNQAGLTAAIAARNVTWVPDPVNYVMHADRTSDSVRLGTFRAPVMSC